MFQWIKLMFSLKIHITAGVYEQID